MAGAASKQSAMDGANTTSEAKTATEQIDQGFVILETNYKLYAYTGILKICWLCCSHTQLIRLYRFTASNCRVEFICAAAISIQEHGDRSYHKRQYSKCVDEGHHS